MPAGRPTVYKESFIKEVDIYLQLCKDEYDEFHKTRGDRSDSYERIVKVNLPTREGFAKHIGVTRQTIDDWSKQPEKKEFSYALSKIDEEQKQRLINMGLSGEYNSTIAKLVLSANHGMAEKNETDLTSKGEKIDGFKLEFIKPNAANNQDT